MNVLICLSENEQHSLGICLKLFKVNSFNEWLEHFVSILIAFYWTVVKTNFLFLLLTKREPKKKNNNKTSNPPLSEHKQFDFY